MTPHTLWCSKDYNLKLEADLAEAWSTTDNGQNTSCHHIRSEHTASKHLRSPSLIWFIYSEFLCWEIERRICFCSVSHMDKRVTKHKTSVRKS